MIGSEADVADDKIIFNVDKEVEMMIDMCRKRVESKDMTVKEKERSYFWESIKIYKNIEKAKKERDVIEISKWSKLYCVLVEEEILSSCNESSLDLVKSATEERLETLRRELSVSIVNKDVKEEYGVFEFGEILSFSGVDMKEVDGDGHCLFRSIAQGMSNGELSEEEEKTVALRLRKLVCKDLKRRRGEELSSVGVSVEELVEMDKEAEMGSFSFREYVRRMRRDEYGGQMEIILLSERLKKKIYVFVEEEENFRRIESVNEEKGIGEPICLVWQKGSTDVSNHYNVLIRRKREREV